MSIFSHVPVRVSGRQCPVVGRSVSGPEIAVAQRAELHLDVSDSKLLQLAQRSREVSR
jgi:hypothetical protein